MCERGERAGCSLCRCLPAQPACLLACLTRRFRTGEKTEQQRCLFTCVCVCVRVCERVSARSMNSTIHLGSGLAPPPPPRPFVSQWRLDSTSSVAENEVERGTLAGTHPLKRMGQRNRGGSIWTYDYLLLIPYYWVDDAERTNEPRTGLATLNNNNNNNNNNPEQQP